MSFSEMSYSLLKLAGGGEHAPVCLTLFVMDVAAKLALSSRT